MQSGLLCFSLDTTSKFQARQTYESYLQRTHGTLALCDLPTCRRRHPYLSPKNFTATQFHQGNFYQHVSNGDDVRGQSDLDVSFYLIISIVGRISFPSLSEGSHFLLHGFHSGIHVTSKDHPSASHVPPVPQQP